MRWLSFALLIGCGAAPRAATAPLPHSRRPPPSVDPPRICSARQQAEAHHPGATPVDTYQPFDVDGDGVLDAMFVSGSGIDNGIFQIFRIDQDGCGHYLGEVESGILFGPPACNQPPAGHQPCQLSCMVSMIHGDGQESLYDFDGETYVFTDYGTRTIPPPP